MSAASAVPQRDPRFADFHPALSRQAALAEANRCLYCFDAPCAQACPTHINVPTFIHRIADGNILGSARTILDANVLGLSCARACPTEVLCEGACVLHRYNRQPIQIGLLQRYAVEGVHDRELPLPFTPAAETGKRVALIGAGPASLACATELRRRGIAATLFDARPLPGGLNTYGIAEYKLPFGVALREVELILRLGVELRSEVTIDAATLAELEASYHALFLGTGLGEVHRLGVPGEHLPGTIDALDLIAGYKSGSITASPRRVAVVGAGNTAIDAAIASVRLGAEDVRILYRRGAAQMSAFASEYDHARHEGVKFDFFVQPTEVLGAEAVQALRLVRLEHTDDGSLVTIAHSAFDLPVDAVVLAIGQATHTSFLADKLKLERGRILVDPATGQTSNPKFFAGGDCVNGGREVVDAVAEGKRAGTAMATWLEAAHAHAA